jgi:hypothetical protein
MRDKYQLYYELQMKCLHFIRGSDVAIEEEIAWNLFCIFYGTKKLSYTNILQLWNIDGTGIEILSTCTGYKVFVFLLRHYEIFWIGL